MDLADGGNGPGPRFADLRRPGLLGRFPAETEKHYRAWLVSQTRPLRGLVWIASIAIWIPMPILVKVWVDTPVQNGIFVMSWVLAIPTLAALLLISRLGFVTLQLAAAGLGLTIIAVAVFYAFYNYNGIPLEAGLLGSMIWLDTLLAFMRTPFRTALVTSSVINAMGSGFLVAAARELNTPRAVTWSSFILVLVAWITIPAMTLVGEQISRQQYVDEQVIARQQEELVRSRAMIRRYAPPAVADLIEHGDTTVDSAQRRRVTIFFADVVGFTTLADRLDPEALAEIVNEYLGSVAQIVENHNGTLNEFAGDGVMAIFGAPQELEPRQQVLSALDAADELQRSLPEWSRRWYPLGIDQDLEARIGINTGVLSIGTFGSAVRATYTGIGLQTNIAARIQAQCSPGSVLLSKTSWHLVSDSVECEPRGEVDVKGVHFPIAMYEPATGELKNWPPG